MTSLDSTSSATGLPRRWGWRRLLLGIVKSIVCAAIGYALPLLVFVIFELASGESLSNAGDNVIHLHSRSHAYNRGALGPSVGCALIFGLAGIVSFIPTTGRRFTRSLIRLGIAAIIGAFAMALFSSLNELYPVVHTEDANAFRRMAIAAIVPTGLAIWDLIRLTLRSRNGNQNRPPRLENDGEVQSPIAYNSK